MSKLTRCPRCLIQTRCPRGQVFSQLCRGNNSGRLTLQFGSEKLRPLNFSLLQYIYRRKHSVLLSIFWEYGKMILPALLSRSSKAFCLLTYTVIFFQIHSCPSPRIKRKSLSVCVACRRILHVLILSSWSFSCDRRGFQST